MKLYCKGEYHNSPAGLHFEKAGVIEIDDAKAEYLLRDAPGNFSRELPQEKPVVPVTTDKQDKAMDAPPSDKQVKKPAKEK